jgi:hypothetical protein
LKKDNKGEMTDIDTSMHKPSYSSSASLIDADFVQLSALNQRQLLCHGGSINYKSTKQLRA